MKKLTVYLEKELLLALREFAALIVIMATLMAAVFFIIPEPFAAARKTFYTKVLPLKHVFIINFFTPYVFITLTFMAGLLVFLHYILAKPRAVTFGIDSSRINYPAAIRDYFAVFIFTVISCVTVIYSMTGIFFIPVATLSGVVFAWWAMAIIINSGGYALSARETLKDIAIVAAILAAGKIINIFIMDFSYYSVTGYFVELGIIYTIGPGVGVLAYPGKGIAVKLSEKKPVALLQSYCLTLFLYASSAFFAALPLFILLIPVILILSGAAAYHAFNNTLHDFEKFSDHIFSMLIVPAGKKSLLYSAYAPVIYLIVYFENLVRWAVHSWDGIVELLSFLFSLHYSLSHYGKTYKEKAE